MSSQKECDGWINALEKASLCPVLEKKEDQTGGSIFSSFLPFAFTLSASVIDEKHRHVFCSIQMYSSNEKEWKHVNSTEIEPLSNNDPVNSLFFPFIQKL